MGKSHSFLLRSLPLLALTLATLATPSAFAQGEGIDANFVGNPRRIPPNGTVSFTDLSVSDFNIRSREWNFGDGTTLVGNNVSPQHVYQNVGVYTVSLTITDFQDNVDTETKVAYITVTEPPFAWFRGTPEVSAAGPQDVVFNDQSVGGNGSGPPVAWFWEFGDGGTSTDQNPVHTYADGAWTVTLTTTFANPVDGSAQRSATRRDYILVGAEAPGSTATAQFTISDAIQDGASIVPLNDWVELFQLRLQWASEEEPAPRNVTNLSIKVIGDAGSDRNYERIGGAPRPDTVYMFGIIKEDDETQDGIYNPDKDFLLADSTGTPYIFDARGRNPFTNDARVTNPDTAYNANDKEYTFNLNLLGDGTPENPQFRMDTSKDGHSYLFVFRPNAYWHAAQTIGVQVPFGLMSAFNPDDAYSPNFLEGAKYEPELGYGASFGVWDATGSISQRHNYEESNSWTWPHHLYTPLSEYIRPRFDTPVANAFDFVTGEYLDIRRVFAVETWVPLIGINLHMTETYTGEPFHGRSLLEANIVMTDLGADPLGTPGNGGFNPRLGLETLTHEFLGTGGGTINSTLASGEDHAFNGIWIWTDGNDNGQFDPPVSTTGGAVFQGDYPMVTPFSYVKGGSKSLAPNSRDTELPLRAVNRAPFNNVLGLPRWEYEPFPPGGGDPWWKIKLHFGFTDRVGSYIEPFPDLSSPTDILAAYGSDFWVVARPDSGYMDSSGLPGDGTGLTQGADFRAFIEPRRVNPNTGDWDGGLYMFGMIPPLASDMFEDGSGNPILINPWQNDALWGIEPWFNQRTVNRNATKPVRGAVEVYDLVLTYESNNNYRKITEINYGSGFVEKGVPSGGLLTNFDLWLDPFGIVGGQFRDFYTVGVDDWRYDQGGPIDDHQLDGFQYPYETAPFYDSSFDVPPFGPRSFAFPVPPPQPALPEYDTWPRTLAPGEYPRAHDWAPQHRQARLLKQHIESDSLPTAMLGFNLAGANDVVTNQFNQIFLDSITVAFWGQDLNGDGRPDFTPSDLLDLHATGTAASSGIQLIEDTDKNGVYGGQLGGDTAVALRNLTWQSAPEPVDLDGDGVADDLNGDGTTDADGDGLVDEIDKAWVVRLRPSTAWPLPEEDAVTRVPTGGGGGGGDDGGGGDGGDDGGDADDEGDERAVKAAAEDGGSSYSLTADQARVPGQIGGEVEGASHWSKKPVRVDASQARLEAGFRALSGAAAKAIGPVGNAGLDLFMVVQTSDKISRFEKFRAFVPSTLPSRNTNDRVAGIQFLPRSPVSFQAYAKQEAEEMPVQPYYDHDLLEANMPVKLIDLTGADETIFIGDSTPVAVLGVDMSTNRGAYGTVDSSAAKGEGSGENGAFTVGNANWAPGSMVGHWLIDSAFSAFEIYANNQEQLSLRSGLPADGDWRIARDPSFLEQVIVEFYDTGRDGRFNINDDLLPLDFEDPYDADPRKPGAQISGVALYLDNDSDPANRNGIFDEDIDIPVELDYPPFLIGQAGEPDTQVMFIFSTPGTDDLPVPMAQQPSRRIPVPDSFGLLTNDPDLGPDLFIVIRPSANIEDGDNFTVGLVPWGPNTPTEPDPDQFAPPPATHIGEFDVFSEFPWGSRALGFITIFSDPRNYDPSDDAALMRGTKWVRSTVNKAEQTSVLTAGEEVAQPDDVVITSVSQTTLPRAVPAAGISIVIRGQGFGVAPAVTLNNIALTVNSAADDRIGAVIPGNSTLTDPVVLKVTNPGTGKFGTYSQFTLTDMDFGAAPRIISISPPRGGSSVFPITITGENFVDANPALREPPSVRFENTSVPVVTYNDTGTRIQVGFPTSGLPQTGPLDVTVINNTNELFTVSLDGFYYENAPAGATPAPVCFIATAAYGSPLEKHLDTFRAFRDGVLLKSTAGTAIVEAYYTHSPALADVVAAHPWLAFVVRMVLTPAAWMLEHGVLTVLFLGLPCAGFWGRRLRAYKRQTA